MTYDALITHVVEGRRRKDRLEVTFLTEKDGKPFECDAYLWVKDDNYRSGLAGSLLKMVQHTGDRVWLTVVDTTWGYRVAWVEKIEKAVPA